MGDALAFEIEPPDTPQVVADAAAAEGNVDPFDAFEIDGAPEVTEDLLRGLLELLGTGANQAADPDVPEQWLFTPSELTIIVPPLTRMVNRHEWARRMIAKGDALAVLAGFGLYSVRNINDGAQARRDREEITDGHLGREAREDPPAAPRAGEPADSPWGHGVPPDEAAGLGQFQG